MNRITSVATVTAAVVLWAPAASYAGPLHPAKPPRPAAEHVPAGLNTVAVSYQPGPAGPATKHRVVHGAKAHALVHSFNHLKRQPKNYVTCDVAGGPTDTVTFRTTAHVWTVTQSACTEVRVVRDDTSLPTLLPTAKWSKAIGAALGPSAGSHHAAAGHGKARAIAEAKRLLAAGPTLPTAVHHSKAPVARLRHAFSTAAYDAIVQRSQFWTVNKGAKQAYAALTATTPAGFRAEGKGTGRGPRPHDTTYFTSYTPRQLPSDIAYASLQLTVTPTGRGTAAYGIYGQAVPRPARPAKESVPDSVHASLLTKVRGTTDKHPLTRTIHGTRARALVKAFDSLPAAAPGESSCAEDHGQYESASFRSHGNVWVASVGPCPGVSVVRDGQRLADLDTSARFLHLLQQGLHSRR